MNPLPTNSARAGAAAGFLAMTLIGWKMADQPPQTQTAKSEESVSKVANRPTRSSRKSAQLDAARQRVAAIRALALPEQRMRATIEFANTLPISEVAAWMDGRWFNTGEGFDLTLFNKILTERWKKEDPEGLLAWSMKNSPGRSGEMLAKWAETDPQRVLDFFKEHPNKEMQLQSLAQIAKKNPAFALQCLRDMPLGGSSENGMSGYYNRQVLAELAKSSPAALEAALASLSPTLRIQAEAILIGQRLEASFNTEFPKLLERPDGWKIFSDSLSNGKGFGDKIFDQLANLPAGWKSSLTSNAYNAIDPSNASKWWNADLEGLGFTDKDAKRIRQIALSRIARNQPEQAIKLMTSSDMDTNAKSNVISNMFSNLSDKPEKAEALIALLSTEEEKEQARKMLTANSDTRSEQKIEKPAEWLEKVAAIDVKNGSSYQYLSMLREWDPEKIADLGNQFRSMPDQNKKQVAQVIASNNSYSPALGPALVGDAIRYLVAQPAVPETENNHQRSSNTIEQASEFAVNWAKKDPTAASTWVQSLPSGEAKLWAQKNLAANWAQYDPQEAAQWIKTLPANERTEVQNFMKTGGRN